MDRHADLLLHLIQRHVVQEEILLGAQHIFRYNQRIGLNTRKIADQIAPRNQTRDRDRAAEEAATNRYDVQIQIFPVVRSDHHAQQRRDRYAAGDGEVLLFRAFHRFYHRIVKFRLQLGKKAYAVFDLREILIGFLFGHLAPGNAVELVRRIDKARAQLLIAFFLPAADDADHIVRLALREGAHRIKPFAVLGQPDRHNRNRLRRRIHRVKIGEGLFQHLSVVDAGTADDLPVELNARIFEGSQLLHDAVGMRVAHHGLSHLSVGSMDADVKR